MIKSRLFICILLVAGNALALDFDKLYQQYGSERARAVMALDYFNEKQLIELESKQMTDVYQVLQPNFDATTIANQLYQHFKAKEQSENPLQNQEEAKEIQIAE